MTRRNTNIVLIVTALVVLAVVGLFAQALVSSRNDRRHNAEQRFNDEAKVSSALISSAFDGSVAAVAENAGKTLGDPQISQKALEAYVKTGKLSYVVVLDAKGHQIAASKGADPSVTAAISEDPKHISPVVAGKQPWGMSGLTKDNIAEYSSNFLAADGSQRTLVQGFPVTLLKDFVGGTLAKLPNAAKERAVVADSTGRVIASAQKNVKVGQPAPRTGGGRTDTKSGITNSAWGVQLSQASTSLYQGTGSSVQWLILTVLGLLGFVALFLLRRAMGQATALETAYGEIELANRDLERTNTELARSNGELEQFASVASHDLQEPLRKVQTFGDQLERRFGEDLNDEAKDYLHRMRNASARMSVLIDDLLRFSRVTTHAKPHVPVDLDRVARDVVQDLEARVDETQGTVEIEPLPGVLADPTQMRQLLQNLIANALKFHRDGVPPVVRVTRADPGEPGMTGFAVADNGIGFEATYEERIFKVFERLHPRDVYAGTGIGLALCRKIAERHGGSIRGDGRPDEGSTFTVTLPAASANGRATAEPARPPVHA